MLFGALYAPEQDFSTVSVWTLKWFREVLNDDNLVSGLKNSLFVATISSSLSTVVAGLAGLALVRSRGLVRYVTDALHLVSLIFPEIVFALALLAWFFILKVQLGLVTVVIAHVTFCLSYVLMTVTSRASTLEISLDEAAQDLGASAWQILFKIHLPLLTPAFVSGFILSFLLSFDDFLITFFVGGSGAETLPIQLYSAMRTGVTPKLNALSSMMFLVTILIVFIFTRTKVFRTMLKS